MRTMYRRRMKYISMTYIQKNGNKYGPVRVYQLLSMLWSPKPRWFTIASVILIFLIIFHHIHAVSFAKFLNDDEYDAGMDDGADINVPDDPTTTVPPVPGDTVIDVISRSPNFKLAVKSGQRPPTEDDQGYNRLLDEFRLQETCQQDPSTIVVDVGAGEFGMYAAACGCTVYMFELQPEKVTRLRSSISHNQFSSPPVNVFEKAVSDLPSDSTMSYSPPEGVDENFVSAQTVRLDDVSWSSQSIYILKVNTAGSELNVLRSAKELFAQKRVKNLVLNYSPWLGEQESQKNVLLYLRREIKPRLMYSLYRNDPRIYGPIVPMHFDTILERGMRSRTPTNIYAVLDTKVTKSSIQSEPFPGG